MIIAFIDIRLFKQLSNSRAGNGSFLSEQIFSYEML